MDTWTYGSTEDHACPYHNQVLAPGVRSTLGGAPPSITTILVDSGLFGYYFVSYQPSKLKNLKTDYLLDNVLNDVGPITITDAHGLQKAD